MSMCNRSHPRNGSCARMSRVSDVGLGRVLMRLLSYVDL